MPAKFGLTDYAACLGGLIEALRFGPVHLAGLSWGGVVALQTYADYPQLVGTLVLADTYAGWKGSLPADEVRARVAGVRQMLDAPDGDFEATATCEVQRSSAIVFPGPPDSVGMTRMTSSRDN